MKSRERLKEMREAPHWGARLALAKDIWPGTELDRLIFECICIANYFDQFLKDGKKSKLHQEQLAEVRDLGFVFAKVIKCGKSDALRKMADALDRWHSHEPSPDGIRIEILRFCHELNKAFTVRAIVNHLQGKNLIPKKLDASSYQNWRKKIVRVCEDFKIKISGMAGNPQLGHEREKKPR
jgi:hypothetical protein